ncbi:hypothetical protein BH09BAC3_BH09BAC3_25010 [soil metagenome]
MLAFYREMPQRFYLQLVQRQFPIRKHSLKNMLVVLQGWIAADKFQHLFKNIRHFFFDLVEGPLIDFAGRKDP